VPKKGGPAHPLRFSVVREVGYGAHRPACGQPARKVAHLLALCCFVRLFAADSIAISIQVAAIPRVAASYRRGARFPRSRAIRVIDGVAYGSLWARRLRSITMTVPAAILSVIVATIRGQPPRVRNAWRRQRDRRHSCKER
jgi:hypothetical protein